MKYLIIGVIVFAILGGFVFWKFGPAIFNRKPPEKKAATLTIFGLWEDEKLLKSAIDSYKKLNPTTTINFVFSQSQNYRSRVQTQISASQGPDILMIHNTWLPMFLKSNSLAAMPKEMMTIEEYGKTFYPVVKENFTKGDKIYAMPRGIDGLALYYNEDILKAVNVEVPQSWDQLRDAAIKATVTEKNPENPDAPGKITTAGLAMGTTGNVDHWSDILGLLFFEQPGAKLEAPNDKNGADVLKFYTDFVLDPKKRVWDPNFVNSTQAFAEGKLAFYFAPSWQAHALRQANPSLNFKIVPVPQLPGKKVGWATYFGYAVSAKSQFPDDAWDFIKYLTSAQSQKQLYQDAVNSGNRLFGLPYSRVELQGELIEDPLAGAFVKMGPDYKSWYLSSYTKDQGINDEMIKYYEDAVNIVLEGRDVQSALETAKKGVDVTLEKYGVTEAKPASL